MRRLDRYLVHMFTVPFLVATAAMLGILVVAEILANLGSFIQYSTGFWNTVGKMATIYSLRLPQFLLLVAPMTMVVGAAFGLSELNKNNELTAMKASGISVSRALAPMFAAAAFFCVVLWADQEYVVPLTENVAMPMYWREVSSEDRFKDAFAVVREDRSAIEGVPGEGTEGPEGGPAEPLRLVGSDPCYHAGYSFVRRRMRNLLIVMNLADGQRALINARSAVPAKGGWALEGVTIGRDLKLKKAFWRTRLSVRDLSYHRVKVSVRPWGELKRICREFPGVPRYKVVLYQRLTYPLTGLILMMLALPLTLKSESVLSRRLLSIGAAVAICLAYFGIEFLAHHLGNKGRLPPAVAAFAPVALGAAGGLLMMDTVRT